MKVIKSRGHGSLGLPQESIPHEMRGGNDGNVGCVISAKRGIRELAKPLNTVEALMTRGLILGCVLLLAAVVLSPSNAFSQTGGCAAAAGQWEFRVFGRDCKGYEEEGKFVLTVDAGCKMQIDILANIPYAEDYLVTKKSLKVENDRFHATVDFTMDPCSMLVLNGRIIDGKRIEGTYKYQDGGGGTFKAVKKKSAVKQPREKRGGAPLFTF